VISTSAALSNSIECALPVLFRGIGFTSDAEEYVTETVRVSQTWLLIRSPHQLRLGSLLSLRWRAPSEMSGSSFTEMRASGRVVSEHQLDDGSLGYKVNIRRSAPLLGVTSH
jgi:hypothetical protein